MAKPVANQVIEAFAFFKKKMPSPQPIDFTCYISARRNARGEFIAGLVLITGIFMAVISATGIGMQTIDLLSGDQHQGPTPGMQAPRPTPQGALPAKQPRNDRQPDLRGAIDHIHNGKFAGNGGRVVSLVMGLALFFFSVSGIRMYWQIF